MALDKKVIKIATKAKQAAQALALVDTSKKDEVLFKLADAIEAKKDFLIEANDKDVKAAQKAGYAKALIDRLVLNEKRIKAMAECLREVARLADPVGETLKTTTRPNGLVIKKMRVPIGVIGIIYESRPNVTSDCVGLCLKAGNAVILKGGKEAAHSNQAIVKIIKDVLAHEGGAWAESVQIVSSTDRAALNTLLKLTDQVDLIIPRGGESLIRFVSENSRIPVVKHYKGVCHTYVSDEADLNMAQKICFNAKVQRPGVCNAMETMLVHRDVAARFLPGMIAELKAAGVEIRGCPMTRKIVKTGVKRAMTADWYAEYLDLILAVRVVDSLAQAVEHINTYGSHHSDAIVTDDPKEAEQFLRAVDSACVYANASTRFTDGYEFGMGAEIGISTDKIHARGPMALEELTTYKFVIEGNGQVRS